MAIILNEEHCYSQSSENLFKIYTTSNWISQRYESITSLNVQVQHEQNGDLYTIDSFRKMKTDIPKGLTKFANKENIIKQKEVWTTRGNGVYNCKFSIKIIEQPIEINGHMIVQPNGNGSINVIELTVNCGIPFIGKVAEKFVASTINKSIQTEHVWIKSFLNKQT